MLPQRMAITALVGVVLFLALLAFIYFYFPESNGKTNLYASVGRDRNAWLVVINDQTGELTKIGKFGYTIMGLAYDPQRDILYGVDGQVGEATNSLFEIDRKTGTAVRIGPLHAENFFGLAYDSYRQKLYGANNKGLYLIRVTTGHAVLVGTFGLNQAIPRELAFDPDSVEMFLGTEGVEAEGDRNGLNLVDTQTGKLRFLGTYKGERRSSNAFNNIRAIEYDWKEKRLLGINEGREDHLVTINTSTGKADLLVKLSQNENYSGLALGRKPQ